jgi:hypothetical protein
MRTSILAWVQAWRYWRRQPLSGGPWHAQLTPHRDLRERVKMAFTVDNMLNSAWQKEIYIEICIKIPT